MLIRRTMAQRPDRADLVEAYAYKLLEGMSTSDLERFFLETIVEGMDSVGLEEVIREVTDFCPELLDEVSA